LGYDRHNGRRYLISEFFPGQILKEYLKENGRIPLAKATEIIDEVAQALEDGNEQGVPHLSLQPNNIILSKEEGARLVNYGFFRLEQLLRESGQPIAESTEEYESPEQRLADEGDQESDVYALGTIFYEMLAGRPPGLGAYQPVSEIQLEVNEAVDVMIAHSRAFDKERRFRTVKEMRLEMHRILLDNTRGWPGQYLRIALARLSDVLAALFSRRGLLIIVAFLALLVASETGRGELFDAARGYTRLALLLVVISGFTGALGYYVVRETARQNGLGSLIAGGRGMGAFLGWLLLFLVVRISEIDDGNLSLGQLGDLMTGDFIGYIFMCVAIVMVLSFIAFVFGFNRIGDVFESRWRRYTLGYYASYLLACVLTLLLALAREPSGILVFD
jgi:hypothetical protein